MKLRHLVSAAALALPAARAHAQPTPAAPRRTLSIATLAPVGSTWMRTLDAWNRELRRRTGGSLALRFYPNGVQGDEPEVVRKMRAGRIDGAALSAVGLAQIYRPVLAFQAPGLFAGYEGLDRARDAMRADIEGAFDHAGFSLLGWGDVGIDRVFSARVVRGTNDLAATRLFQWREDLLAAPFYEELHVRGVVLDLPEVLTALQTHQLDTVVASPLTVASLQWAAHLPHMLDLPVAIEIGAMVVAKPAVDGLSPEQRAALRDTAVTFTALLRRNVRRDDEGAVAPMRARGLAVDAPTEAQRAGWTAAFTRTRARLVGPIADAAFFGRIETARGAH